MTGPRPSIGEARGRLADEPEFPLLAKVLHWSTAVLVLAMFCVGILMTEIGSGAWAEALRRFHNTAGFVLLILVVVRIVYRLQARLRGLWPGHAGGRAAHRLLYLLLVAIPLLGLAGVSDLGAREIYGGISLPEIWPKGTGYADLLFLGHAILAFTLVGLVVLHICLALDDYIRHPAKAAAARRPAAAKPPSILPPDVP